MATKKEKGEKKATNFEDVHTSFKRNLESLEVFVENVAPIAEKQDAATSQKQSDIIRQIFEIVSAHKGKIEKTKRGVVIKPASKGMAEKVTRLASGLPRLPQPQAQLLYRSAFVMLISYFDFLLADLLHYFYHNYPESLTGKELSLTLKDLKLLGSIDDAVEIIIGKEVDNVLYDSLEKQKSYLKTNLKIDTKDDIINWSRLTEAMERRHIVVHNNCKVSRRYLSNVDLSQVPEKTRSLKEGMKVEITESYFRSIFEEICVAGIVLMQNCWRKWKKEDVQKADQELIIDIYDALVKEDWTCAERLGLFAKGCSVVEQASRLTLEVNHCQSLKWQGKKEGLEKELEKFDVSALSPKFVLALCALKSDHDGFYKNIENAVIVDEMSKEHFMEWPLFRELRKDPQYEERINEVLRLVNEKQES